MIAGASIFQRVSLALVNLPHDKVGALISVGCYGVSTESGSDRVSVISKIRIANYCYPVATALGTDLITILGHRP